MLLGECKQEVWCSFLAFISLQFGNMARQKNAKWSVSISCTICTVPLRVTHSASQTLLWFINMFLGVYSRLITSCSDMDEWGKFYGSTFNVKEWTCEEIWGFFRVKYFLPAGGSAHTPCHTWRRCRLAPGRVSPPRPDQTLRKRKRKRWDDGEHCGTWLFRFTSFHLTTRGIKSVVINCCSQQKLIIADVSVNFNFNFIQK